MSITNFMTHSYLQAQHSVTMFLTQRRAIIAGSASGFILLGGTFYPRLKSKQPSSSSTTRPYANRVLESDVRKGGYVHLWKPTRGLIRPQAPIEMPCLPIPPTSWDSPSAALIQYIDRRTTQPLVVDTTTAPPTRGIAVPRVRQGQRDRVHREGVWPPPSDGVRCDTR